MRRTDREVTGFDEIIDILRRADTIRLGLHDAPYPYVVPLSFGLEAGDGRITLYFHGAAEGLKHELLARDPHVCVEADIFHRYAERPGSVTTAYESFVGFGTCARVHGEEAARGIDLLLEHCGFAGYGCAPAELERTRVYKIALERFTGKRNFP
ncbi:MAG: pyridoxamine 5'-phosphate oxidase family protein [Oscillospiraceae bacterium]|nr:pyridoxamine 5'-phosphate oxidase family protein [Oscillospiraceae bacterium]